MGIILQNKIIDKTSFKTTDKRFSALINLLEDENLDIASLAISELLSYNKNFESVISELQESQNCLIRQRSHQLQAIINIRKNRERFTRRLNNKASGLWQGLNELHLLWYDNDNSEELKDLRKDFIDEATTFKPANSKALANFMNKMTFVCSSKGDLEPDYYCIGSVLDSKVGADFILCSIAKTIAMHFNYDTNIIFSKENGFNLIDKSGNMISPLNWKIKRNIINHSYEIWFPGMILKHALFQLYLCALSSDSYRYTYSISSCLAKMLNTDKTKDLFPYPYNFA